MEYQKIAKPTGDMIGNKIANKVIQISRSSIQSKSETIANKHDKEMPKQRYISLDRRQKNY